MAAPRVMHRDRWGRFCPPPPPPQPPYVPPDPRRFPTARDPRYRLRVFGRAWPWRAEYQHAIDDALASGHAEADKHGRAWLITPADVQQDPPRSEGLEWLRAIRSNRAWLQQATQPLRDAG